MSIDTDLLRKQSEKNKLDDYYYHGFPGYLPQIPPGDCKTLFSNPLWGSSGKLINIFDNGSFYGVMKINHTKSNMAKGNGRGCGFIEIYNSQKVRKYLKSRLVREKFSYANDGSLNEIRYMFDRAWINESKNHIIVSGYAQENNPKKTVKTCFFASEELKDTLTNLVLSDKIQKHNSLKSLLPIITFGDEKTGLFAYSDIEMEIDDLLELPVYLKLKGLDVFEGYEEKVYEHNKKILSMPAIIHVLTASDIFSMSQVTSLSKNERKTFKKEMNIAILLHLLQFLGDFLVKGIPFHFLFLIYIIVLLFGLNSGIVVIPILSFIYLFGYLCLLGPSMLNTLGFNKLNDFFIFIKDIRKGNYKIFRSKCSKIDGKYLYLNQFMIKICKIHGEKITVDDSFTAISTKTDYWVIKSILE